MTEQTVINGIPVHECKVCGGACWRRHSTTGLFSDDDVWLHIYDQDWKDAENPHNAEPGEPWTKPKFERYREAHS